MRDLSEVLEKIIDLIPEKFQTTKSELAAIGKSSLFAAPEMQSTFWNKAASILNNANFPDDEEWVEQSKNIFRGETEF